MSSATLAGQLAGLVPSSTEATAVARLADAYGTYAADAVAGAAPITAAGVVLGKAAMTAALAGMNAPGAGSAVLTKAVQAFWAAVAAGLASSFAGAVAVAPPPHAGLEVALDAAFAANVASGADLVDAAQVIATALHNQAIIGGTVTFPGPVTSPIT
jgi:hypothetical protein